MDRPRRSAFLGVPITESHPVRHPDRQHPHRRAVGALVGTEHCPRIGDRSASIRRSRPTDHVDRRRGKRIELFARKSSPRTHRKGV
jgi:hypothetical protein